MILANIAGVARPVRIVANSSLAKEIARSIFSSASKSVSSITYPVASSNPGRPSHRGDERSDPLTDHSTSDGVLTLGPEHEHGQPVVHTQAERGRVHHPQSPAQRLVEGHSVQFDGCRVGTR